MHDRRVAEGDHAWRQVPGYDRSGADHRPRADIDVRQDRDVDADLRSWSDLRPAHHRRGAGVAGVQIVGCRHARREERVVADLRELSDVAIAVDLDPVTDPAAVVDHRVGPDTDVVTKHAVFPYD